MPQPTLQRDELYRVMDDLPDAPDMLLPLLDWLATYLRRTAWITDSADYAKWSRVIEHETRLRWIEDSLSHEQ